jgi:uncharacterized protein with von Willebrand factor type A (vWA) domain
VTDLRALARLLDELVWTLRREGFVVAPSQVRDLAQAVHALGWDSPFAVREAVACIVIAKQDERRRFDAVFGAFFVRERPSADLWARLAAEGFAAHELEALRDLLEAMARPLLGGGIEQAPVARMRALLEGGAELDQILQLAGVRRLVDDLRSPLQLGFLAQRTSDAVGVRDARARLVALRQHLRGALGGRGDALADALARELDRAGDLVREHLRRSLARSDDEARPSSPRSRLHESPFTSLTDAELEEVARAVRSFADRLRGAERVRRRRARRGRMDPGRTVRALLRTGGVPFNPVRRRRRRDRPRLVLLCDVSESVRTASRFMLELVYAAHEIFDRTRSFVFVSELGETTSLFEREPARVALAAAYGGEVVPVTDNSNYGRVLRAFESRYLDTIDRRTTVIILGDGRTNYHDAAEASLERVRARARAVYWFSSEPRAGWSSGDSAMARYAPLCTAVLQVTTARELEEATRTLLWSR